MITHDEYMADVRAMFAPRLADRIDEAARTREL